MKKCVLTAFPLGGMPLGTGRMSAQMLPATPWFEVNNNGLLLKTATDSRLISKSLSLPNGTYLDYQKKAATLADGTHVELREGDAVTLNKWVRRGQGRFTVLAAPANYHFETAKGESGTVIYQPLASATGCQQFVFDADSNFTIGYLLTLQPVATQ